MSLHYICSDNLKTNLIDISLTGNDNCTSKLSNKKYIHLFTIFNISEKSTRELQSKRRTLKGFCVCFKSCIWKTSKVKSNHLFFILDKKILGKKCPDPFKKNY